MAPNIQYYGQPPLYPQNNVIMVPTYRPFLMNQMLTTITPNLRAFFIISGVLYLIWSLLTIGLDVVIIVKSSWSFYRGIWAIGFLLGGGISMLIITCRTSYAMNSLIRMFVLILFFCLLGFILSAVNYGTSRRCIPSRYTKCDKQLVSILKMTNLVVFIVATIHTIINIIVLNHEHKKTMARTTGPHPPNH
jgi:hypothetical protein